ncbi:hypothetical protein HYQ46_005591 [Verticillium longisporum]|nr:hypothetical protein HYQ46_005591 [Verticillium longisporum]
MTTLLSARTFAILSLVSLEAQCFCTNNSFNVAQVAAQCAACMHNANRDTDDNEDINDIMFTCGFSFNVAQVAAQCAACMHNANRDTDDNEDINDIMFTCGFSIQPN